MTTIWGPAFDAEIDYRRSTIATAARRRPGRRATRTQRARAARRTTADQRPQVTLAVVQAAGIGRLPATASPRR